MKAEISVQLDSVQRARAVTRAVAANNVGAPKGMRIITWSRGNLFKTHIEWEGRLETFISTIDDLLSSLHTALKAADTVELTST